MRNESRPETRSPHATSAENARFGAFAAHLAADGFSPATRACYASDWWNVAERAHAATGRRFRLDAFGADGFRAQRDELSRLGSAPATLNRRLAFLRRYAAFAAESEPALARVAAEIAEIPFLPLVRRPVRALTHAQEERLRDAADAAGPRESALVALLLGTGLRAGEAAALRRSDVVVAPGPGSLVRVRGPRSKTAVLPPRSRDRLEALLRSAKGRAADPVFVAAGGGALGEEGVADAVERVAAAAGVTATARTLRHTFAVRYLSEHRDDVEGLARALGQKGLAAARAYRAAAGAGPPAARVVRWADAEESAPTAGVSRRVISGALAEAERTVLAAGAALPSHSHPDEQFTFVLRGRCTCESRSGSSELSTGDVLHLPGGEPHSFTAGPSGAVLLHVFSPPRRSAFHAG